MADPAPDPSFDAAIAFAAELIRIPSPPGGEERVARRVVEEMRRLAYDQAWTDEVGNAVGVIRGDGRAPPVMLSCHLDVVDAGDEAAWERPPYGGEIADGYLHGRGAMDIKGPLALQTYAAARFARFAEPAAGSTGGSPPAPGRAGPGERRPPGDIIVAHTVFEERGGWGMAHLLERAGLRPGVVVIGEATGGDVCIGHRGRAEVEIEIRGRAGHASVPEAASNALDGAAAVLEAIRRLPAARLASEDAVLGRSTLVATGIEATPASRNVVPDRVVIALDWRVLPGMTADAGLDLVRHWLADEVRLPDGLTLSVAYTAERQRSWTGLETTWEMFGPGFLVPPESPVVRAAADAIASATGTHPAVRPWRFATDGRHTCGDHGIPTLGYAPGDEAHAHTNTERLELEPARVAYEAYPALIGALFEAVGTSSGPGC